MSDVKEFVLPSGAFAMVRNLTGKDYLVALQASREGLDMVFCLMCTAVRIDGEALKYDQLLAMDLRDVMELHRHMAPYFVGPISHNLPDKPS